MFPGYLSVPLNDTPGDGVNKAKGCVITVLVIKTIHQSTLTMIQ
jgi:hypothetical protein